MGAAHSRAFENPDCDAFGDAEKRNIGATDTSSATRDACVLR
jgi:hypothetical protein